MNILQFLCAVCLFVSLPACVAYGQPSWYRDKQHSLFTYFFLKALRGDADADKNKVLTAAEISDYVSDQVLSIARRRHSRDQNPEFFGNTNAVMVRY